MKSSRRNVQCECATPKPLRANPYPAAIRREIMVVAGCGPHALDNFLDPSGGPSYGVTEIRVLRALVQLGLPIPDRHEGAFERLRSTVLRAPSAAQPELGEVHTKVRA